MSLVVLSELNCGVEWIGVAIAPWAVAKLIAPREFEKLYLSESTWDSTVIAAGFLSILPETAKILIHGSR